MQGKKKEGGGNFRTSGSKFHILLGGGEISKAPTPPEWTSLHLINRKGGPFPKLLLGPKFRYHRWKFCIKIFIRCK